MRGELRVGDVADERRKARVLGKIGRKSLIDQGETHDPFRGERSAREQGFRELEADESAASGDDDFHRGTRPGGSPRSQERKQRVSTSLNTGSAREVAALVVSLPIGRLTLIPPTTSDVRLADRHRDAAHARIELLLQKPHSPRLLAVAISLAHAINRGHGIRGEGKKTLAGRPALDFFLRPAESIAIRPTQNSPARVPPA